MVEEVTVSDEKWELVIEDSDEKGLVRVERLRLPGGWLYRHEQEVNGERVIAMAFAPVSPDK